MPPKIKYLGLKKQFAISKPKIFKEYSRIFSNSSFILREDVKIFEKKISKILNSKYAVGLNSGTDALFMALIGSGIKTNDEVITVSHTPVMTISAIKHIGAKPIFVDIANDFNIDPDQIEKKITYQTKAILVVHLNGRSCDMKKIMKIVKKHKLKLIEDCAQSIGTKYNNKPVGSFGEVGCFSLHPFKTLNVPGDGGFIITSKKKIFEKIMLLRDHGLLLPKSKDVVKCFGVNSRLDNIHAATALVHLRFLDKWIRTRRKIASFYNKMLSDVNEISLPPKPENKNIFYDTYNSYVIIAEKRNSLKKFLNNSGIEVLAMITKGIHLQKNLKLGKWFLPNTENLGKKVLSLPIYPTLNLEEQNFIVKKIKDFYD